MWSQLPKKLYILNQNFVFYHELPLLHIEVNVFNFSRSTPCLTLLWLLQLALSHFLKVSIHLICLVWLLGTFKVPSFFPLSSFSLTYIGGGSIDLWRRYASDKFSDMGLDPGAGSDKVQATFVTLPFFLCVWFDLDLNGCLVRGLYVYVETSFGYFNVLRCLMRWLIL